VGKLTSTDPNSALAFPSESAFVGKLTSSLLRSGSRVRVSASTLKFSLPFGSATTDPVMSLEAKEQVSDPPTQHT
jgi:hypothetical protein